MAIMKKIGTAVLGLAIFIGCIGKFFPYMFMSLPFPLSIILWVSTGNSMPPYFMPDAWKEDEIDSWMKDGDLVVSVGVKSGTTFSLYCTHQIRTKGNDTGDELWPDVSISTPWPDLRQSRRGTWANQKDRYNTTILANGRKMKDFWDNPTYPFRIFKSHYAPPVLPVRKKGGKKIKYLAMVRNGMDFAASATEFFASMTEEIRNLWGGFPPVIPEEAVKGGEPPAIVKDVLPGGPMEDIYFGYVKSWWSHRNDPNVLLLHYSDARKDLKGHVAKIAKFLEVDLTQKELKTVTERCSLEHMQKVNRFSYKMPLNQDKSLWDVDTNFIVGDGALTKVGRVGTGRAMFSDKFVAQWKKAEEDEFGYNPAMLKWAREGGEFPVV